MMVSKKLHVGVQATFTAMCTLAVFGFLGCGKRAAESSAGNTKATGHEAHDHAETGPHQGQLIELGEEEYHGELIHDDANQKVTVYVLDGKAQSNVPIAASEIALNIMVGDKPTQFKLAALPDSNDPSGNSSRFELTDKSLSDALDAAGSAAHLNLNINGTPYTGIIEHHEHHGHDHK